MPFAEVGTMSGQSMRNTVWLVLLCVVLVACAAGPNPLIHQAAETRGIAGFWLGLWHGLIAWVTFIVSLFDPQVSVYEVHNSGWPYNLGFVIGAGAFHGGGGASARKRKKVRATIEVGQ